MSNSDTAGLPVHSNPTRHLLRPIRWQLSAAALLAAVGAMFAVAPMIGIAHLARLLPGRETAAPVDITGTIGASVACLALGMALVFAAELTAHLADNRLSARLRLDTARRLACVPLGWFTSRTSGEVKQAMQDDIATLHSLTAHFFTAAARAVGAIVIAVLYLLWLDWRLALIALLPFPGFFVFLRRAMRAGAASMAAFAGSLAQINGAAGEFVSCVPVIKTFGAAGNAHGSYRDAVDGFADAFVDFTRPLVPAMAHAHAMIAPVTVLGVVLAAGTGFVAQGAMTAADVLPFALVAPGICAPLLLLHTLLHDLGSATGAAARVAALLETPVLPPLATGTAQTPSGHTVRFEQVSYGYDGAPPALTGISFTLAPGTVTAIVGPSGAGKSTVARLLLRFFDPSHGHITLGGVDLRQLDASALYQRIGFVLQEVRLIHATVRDNITLGRPAASQHEVEEAARIANIHERILALPRGYDSVIGEDAELSGGERQRVSIARAVLIDPPVLVLDEATSASDAGNEVAVQNALSRFAAGRTVLVIAHRLQTIMHADQILVMHDGAIAEQGTHAQLLAHGGRYARLWMQSEQPH